MKSLVEELLRPGTRLIVGVPVETIDEGHALRHVEAECVNLRDKHQERAKRLRTRRNADLGCLGESVDRVAAGTAQRDDLCTGVLRRIKIFEEALGVQGMSRTTEHPAARPFDRHTGVLFKLPAERIVDGDEVPGVESEFDHRRSDTGRI